MREPIHGRRCLMKIGFVFVGFHRLRIQRPCDRGLKTDRHPGGAASTCVLTAGYRGAKHLESIEAHGDIAHVVGRRTESENKKRHPHKKARRWVVEVCYG